MVVTRRSDRIQLSEPIDAVVGAVEVQVVDVSPTGFKVHHTEPLPPRGASSTFRFTWNGVAVRLECVPIWTTIHRFARSTSERPTLASGLRINDADPASRQLLADMLAQVSATTPIVPALGPEARGIRIEPYLYCELVNGKWQRKPASRPDQPAEGFTLSANEQAAQVERLCAAYANGDGETRKLIRTLAALSIKSQGSEAGTAGSAACSA